MYFLGVNSAKQLRWKSALGYFEEIYNIYKFSISNDLYFDLKILKNVLYFLSLCYLNLGFQRNADDFKRMYEKLNLEDEKNKSIPEPKLTNPSNYIIKKTITEDLSANNDEFEKIDNSLILKSNYTNQYKNLKEWLKDDIVSYLNDEKINSKLIDSLSTSNITGKILNDYFLLITNNSSFFKHLIQL